MKEMLCFLGVATLGSVIYHSGQKALPTQVNPMLLLVGIYAVALLLAGLALPFFQDAGHPLRFGPGFPWAVLGVGLGILLIEGGFLLAYRHGASLQWSGVAVNGLAAVVLVPVAVLLFREGFSLAKAMGILLTLSGMALLVRR